MSLAEPEPEPELHPEPESEPEAWNMSVFSVYPESETGTSEPEAEPSFGPCAQGILVSLAVVIIVVGSMGNTLVVAVIGRMRTGRTVTEIFLTSLAIADLLVCMICTPLLVVGIIVHSGHTGASYQVEQFLFYFSSVASIFNLAVIALDRHDAVLHPMSRRFTIQRCKPLLLIIWLLSASIAVIIHFIPQMYEVIVLAVCFVFPFAAMVISYVRILNVAKKSERKAAGADLNPASSKEPKASKMDKTVKMVVIVVVVFVVSWVPSLISRLLKYVIEMTPSTLSFMEVSACLIAYAGSALNFMVYAFMSRRFKVGLSQLFGCNRFIRRVDPTDGDIGKTCKDTVNKTEFASKPQTG